MVIASTNKIILPRSPTSFAWQCRRHGILTRNRPGGAKFPNRFVFLPLVEEEGHHRKPYIFHIYIFTILLFDLPPFESHPLATTFSSSFFKNNWYETFLLFLRLCRSPLRLRKQRHKSERNHGYVDGQRC